MEAIVDNVRSNEWAAHYAQSLQAYVDGIKSQFDDITAYFENGSAATGFEAIWAKAAEGVQVKILDVNHEFEALQNEAEGVLRLLSDIATVRPGIDGRLSLFDDSSILELKQAIPLY
jgi:hypothetical protein